MENNTIAKKLCAKSVKANLEGGGGDGGGGGFEGDPARDPSRPGN